MRWPRWLKRRKERRRSPRIPVDFLTAIYWEGSANSSHPVPEVSLDGALVQTSTNWCEGTLIRVSLRRIREEGAEPNSNESKSYVDLWCRVVRQVPEGICVEFLFFRSVDRKHFREFLESIDVRPGNERRKAKRALQWTSVT